MTLRELAWMVDGRRAAQWHHTSHVLAMLYNTHRGEKAGQLDPRDFDPMVRQREAERPPMPAPIEALKALM